MKKIIVNADDFGYRTQINNAIVYAYKNGVVRSTSMLVNRDAFEEAVLLAKENPGLGIGLHIDLDKYFDIEHGVGTVKGWVNNTIPTQQIIKDEIKKQIEKLLSAGIQIDHFDSHHHTHLFPGVLPIVVELCKEYNVNKIRFFNKFGDYDKQKELLVSNGIKFPEHFIEGWYYGNVDEDYNVSEIMTHPGYGEIWREKELLVCCDVLLKEYCQRNNIELIKFSDL
ncbi:carbohydrate deacetylase [Candidatus Ruminimicrobiellum ovillum]|uniref:carbohydrate deacetylase n=1 Tax=Candidatus Ruminimicrobiellum ovillum TaxID=1947927 RepID=UPI00355A68E0